MIGRAAKKRAILPHFTVSQAVSFVEAHGYALLLAWVLVDQRPIPLPSIPLLLAGGALIRIGQLRAPLAIACCVTGALVADIIWFQLGRRRGRRILTRFWPKSRTKRGR